MSHASRDLLGSTIPASTVFLLTMLVSYWVGGWFGVAAFAVILTVALTVNGNAEWLWRLQRGRELRSWEAPELFAIVADLSRRAGIERPRLFLLPAQVPNAMAAEAKTGGAIAVTQGLLRLLNRRELTGVLAHELSHIKHSDLRWTKFTGAASRAALSLLNVGLWVGFVAFWLTGDGSGHWFLALLLSLTLPILLRGLTAWMSRSREYAADAAAAQLTQDPAGLASALWKLDRVAQGWLGRWFTQTQAPDWLSSHPPTRERMRRLAGLSGHRDVAPDDLEAARQVHSGQRWRTPVVLSVDPLARRVSPYARFASARFPALRFDPVRTLRQFRVYQ